MKIGDYIELYYGEYKLPEFELFFGFCHEDTWSESWRKIAGNNWLQEYLLKVEFSFAKITKKTVSYSDEPKQGYSKVTKVYWDREKFNKSKIEANQ